MNKIKGLMATSLVAILAGIVGCDTGNSSLVSNTSSSSSNIITGSNSTLSTSSSSTSSFISVYTEELTSEMFERLKGGYAATVVQEKTYEGSKTSYSIRDIKVNDKNYDLDSYMSTDGKTKGTLSNDSHYQINPDEEEEYTYTASLSIGNTVMYTSVLTKDPFTYEEVPMTWEESGYSNVFASLSIGDFERVDNENKFALKLEDPTLAINKVYSRIGIQLYGEAVNSNLEYFYLITNGNEITGFELKYETFLSYETLCSNVSSGKFTDFGADVISFEVPLQGREKYAELDEAIALLQNQNYEIEHTQGGYDYSTGKFVPRGKFVGKVENGEKLEYDYYTGDGYKYMNYCYYNSTYTDVDESTGQDITVDYIQGAINIKGNYFNENGYIGQVRDILPDFNVSSEMFIKSSESTETKAIFDLDKSIKISKDNDNGIYSPFDTDGYRDLTVYLTITVEEDKITFHNETSHKENVGLIEDVVFTNIGKVSNIIAAENIKDNCDDLTWTDLLSNNQYTLNGILSVYTEEFLNAIPTLGGIYAFINIGGSSNSPVFYVQTYSQEENNQMLMDYGAKLEAVGFEASIEEDDYGNVTYIYKKPAELNGRTYTLNISIDLFWNKILEIGQFQIKLSMTK